jgi:hypothetical protein
MTRSSWLVVLILCWLCAAIDAQTQALPVLYDSRIKPSLPVLKPEVQKRVIQDVLRAGATALKRDCHDGKLPEKPSVKAVARGSFTRRAVAQTAYLVELCPTKRYTEVSGYGLAVYVANRLVLVSGVQITDIYGVALEFFGIHDLNLNGLDELGLVWGSGDGCCSSSNLSLLELTGAGLKSTGQVRVAAADGSGEPALEEAWTVYVIRGAKPILIGVDRFNRQAVPARLTLQPADLELQNWLR